MANSIQRKSICNEINVNGEGMAWAEFWSGQFFAFLNGQTFYFVVSFWKERIASSQRLDLKRHFSLCSLFDLRRNPLMPASSLDENSIFWQQQRYICYQIPLRMNLLLAQAFHVYARFDWPRLTKNIRILFVRFMYRKQNIIHKDKILPV